MPDFPVYSQSGTGMKNTNDAGTGTVPDNTDAVRHFFGPVPDWISEFLNADAGVSFLMPMPSYAKNAL